jgi:putative transposase
MKNRRHTPEQVIRKLVEGDKLLAQGKDGRGSGSPSRDLRAGFPRWRKQYAGMKADEASWLKEFDDLTVPDG